MPDPKTTTTPKSDDTRYVSPTSDDSVAERFAKVRAKEAEMTSAELLAALRSTPSLFDDEINTEDEN